MNTANVFLEISLIVLFISILSVIIAFIIGFCIMYQKGYTPKEIIQELIFDLIE